LSPFAVILSAAKNLALPAQGKLREGSSLGVFQGHARFFVAAAPQNDSRGIESGGVPRNAADLACPSFEV
jgi:hypothetical protein